MTIPLTGAGSLFVRLGHIAPGVLDPLSLAGAAANARVLSGANLATRVFSTILPDYANGTAIPQVVGGTGSASLAAQLAGLQTQISSFPTSLQVIAQNTLKVMYGIDQLAIPAKAPLSQFSSISLQTAIKVLIAQMIGAGASVQQATVSIGTQTAVGSPNGNPVIVMSLKNGDGLSLQLPFPETLTFRCTRDAQGGATAGSETVTVYGQTASPSLLSYLYPSGSGITQGLTAINGANDNSGGNILVNSDFQTYSNANYPDNWVIAGGTAGTQIINSGSGQAYTPSGGSVEFAGDGASTASLTQLFGTARSTAAGLGGSPATRPGPSRVYHFNGWLKVSAVPSAGVMQFALVDESGNITQNAQGANNSVTLDLTTATTGYVAINGSFQTPLVLPTKLGFRIKMSTAIDNAKNVFLGRFSMSRSDVGGNGLYAGGPFCTIHSGSANMINGYVPDTWTSVIANSYQTSGSGLMQSIMDRLFNLRTIATPSLQLPYSGSPTISDSLIA